MIRSRSFTVAVLALGAAAGLLTACTSAPDTAETEASACAAATAFSEAVASAKTTLADSPKVADVTAARDGVKSAYTQLQSALGDVAADRQQAVADAWSSFNTAVDDLDPDADVADASATLTEEIAAVQKAQDELEADLTCE